MQLSSYPATSTLADRPRTRARTGGPPEPERHPGARPSPEALYLGLERWAVTRNQLDVPEFRRFCRQLIAPYADLLEMLARQKARLRIVGLAASPSCGIDTTSSGYRGGRVREQPHMHVAGRGVFMEELLAELERRAVDYRAEEADRKERTGLPIGCPGRDTNTVK